MQIENCYEDGVTEHTNLPASLSNSSKLDQVSQQRVAYHNCTGCSLPILDSLFLLLDNNYWHTACLRCSICSVSLGEDMTCFVKDNRNYCRQDYQRFFSPRWCQRCGTHIEPYELVMKVQGGVYHANHFCFSCVSCQRPLVTGEKYMFDERGLGCMACVQANNHSRKRKQNITSTHIDSMGGMAASYVTHGDLGNSATERQQSSGNYRQTQKIKRMRTSFKHHQLKAMKSYFTINHNPDAKDLKQLAQETGLTKRVLQVWFQNARAKYRRTSDQDTKCSSGIEMKSIPEIKTEIIPGENDESGMLDSNSDSFTFSIDNSPGDAENFPYESSSHSEEIIDSIPSPKQHQYHSFYGCIGKQGTNRIGEFLHKGYRETMVPTSSASSSALQSL